MPRPPFRAAWLALALGAIATAACTGTAPPPPAATKIASFDPVNSPRGYVDAVALTADATLVAIGERAGEIRIWSVDWTPEERSRLTRPARWERRERGQR